MSSKTKPREAEPNFEGAMDRLEKIVEQMELGKLPLEDLIVRYEEGMKLVKTCQDARNEQKIEIITATAESRGRYEFEPARKRVVLRKRRSNPKAPMTKSNSSKIRKPPRQQTRRSVCSMEPVASRRRRP
jgi:exodeoxyribonuclease VII small subunit